MANIKAVAKRVISEVEASEANRIDPREVARQVAERASAYRRIGWQPDDYNELHSTVFRGVLDKLEG